jgi:hypothetical protein
MTIATAEGQLELSINERGQVLISIEVELQGPIEMWPQQAISLAQALLKHAREAARPEESKGA